MTPSHPMLPPDARSEAFPEDLLDLLDKKPAPRPRAAWRRLTGLLPGLVLVVALAGASVWPLSAAYAATAAEVAADLRMAEDAAPMRRVADRFTALALAGDAAGTSAMLSRALVDRIGEAAATRAMQAQILPFFAQGGTVGRSVTVTRTTDAAGQSGFAFYLWLERAPGDARPFTVYVVDEGGTPRIANIVPDRLVAGRHQ